VARARAGALRTIWRRALVDTLLNLSRAGRQVRRA
jgi:hypothetical protein